jgi:hypothetical protein
MGFRISALDVDQFRHLFDKDAETLAAFGVERMTVDNKPGYPCRVSLQDADVGETVLLMNYEHQPASSPYRASHAIFVREWADQARPGRNDVPEMLRTRLLSVRAFDCAGMMVDAEIVGGVELETLIERMLANDSVSYLHLHNAGRGCYVARAERA